MCKDQPGRRNGVLITRPEGAAGRTAEAVRARGLVPVAAPLLRVEERAVRAVPGVDAVLVTSGNAVAGVAGMALPLLAVGDATAARAREAGFATVESACGDAAALLALARARLRPGARLLLASGAGQGRALAAGLREAGFIVHRRVAYVARPVPGFPAAAAAALGADGLRAALFLSGETASVFARLLPRRLAPALAGVEALAIAPGVGRVLAPLPFRRVRVSVAPTLEDVLDLL